MSEIVWVEWVTIACGKCGIQWKVTKEFDDDKREHKTTFYCPNGHSRAYVERESDRLRRERDQLAQQVAQRDDEIARQRTLREETERRLTATRGIVTRIKNRVGHGVCPCCSRTFENLARHMTSKHPTFAAEAAE